MDIEALLRGSVFDDHRGARRHRFMESADINAAFREFFTPLRSYVRRGMHTDGQLYAVEMDVCIPGVLLAADWLPLASRGIAHPAVLADAPRRRAIFDRLLAEDRPEALFAYVCERADGPDGAVLHLEIASADGTYAADFPIRTDSGRQRRELSRAPHRRLLTADL